MDIEELQKRFLKILNRTHYDPEVDHSDADDLLLEYIDDPEVTNIFEDIEKWYA